MGATDVGALGRWTAAGLARVGRTTLNERDLRRLFRRHVAPLVGPTPARFASEAASADRPVGDERVSDGRGGGASESLWRPRDRRAMRPADFVTLGVASPDELADALARRWRRPDGADGRARTIEATVQVATKLRAAPAATSAEVSATTYVMH
ncbi:MAG: hypothetical protein OEY23_20035 [Acidimicrobiia bacterium]|nr:hypothetical protein [Acidimicrobiia bacterium]